MLGDITGTLACAMCKDLLGGVQSQMAKGYFWSILLLLAVPFGIMGCITWRVVSAMRRKAS